MPIATSAISGALPAFSGALPAFHPGLAAAQVDQSLRQALATYDAARQCALLWFCEVLERGLYRNLGYASMEQYATESLGFSRNRMWQFMRLARDLERLPPVKEAVTSGQLAWTKAQQVARIATARTAQSWVDQAATSSRRELAQKIKKTRADAKMAAKEILARQGVLGLGAGAAPAHGEAETAAVAGAPVARVTVTLTFDSLEAARLEAMIEAAKKSGAVAATATREEAILAGMAALLEGGAGRAAVFENARSPAAQPDTTAPNQTPAGPDLRRHNYPTPYKVVLYRCEACERTEVVTSSGRRKLDPATAHAALENAVVHHHNGKNRHAVAPATREKVLARDGHRCQAPGCKKARFLEIHHLIPREKGGSNKLDNLVTLCSRCHRFAHENMHAQAQAQATARWGAVDHPRAKRS